MKIVFILVGLTLLGLLLGAYTTGDLEKVKFKVARQYQRMGTIFRFHYYVIIKRKVYLHAWYVLTRKCPMCLTRGRVSVRHQNCAYVDKMLNYYWLCPGCHQEVHSNYQELWDEYNAGRL